MCEKMSEMCALRKKKCPKIELFHILYHHLYCYHNKYQQLLWINFESTSLIPIVRAALVQENSSVQWSASPNRTPLPFQTPTATSWEPGDLSDCPSFVSMSRLWGARTGQSHSFYSSTFQLLLVWEDPDGCCRRLKMFPFMLFFFSTSETKKNKKKNQKSHLGAWQTLLSLGGI